MIIISYHEVIYNTFRQNKHTQNQISVKEPLQRYPVALESFRISETFIHTRLLEMLLACWCCCRGDLVTHKTLENSTDSESLQHSGINLYPCHVAVTMPLLYSMSVSSSRYLTSTAIEGEAHLPLLLPLSLPLFCSSLGLCMIKG